MELVNTLFASLVGTDPFTGVDITIANEAAHEKRESVSR